jgi:hypothetical protein
MLDRQPEHVGFDSPPHVGHGALGGYAQQLAQGVAGAGLNDRCAQCGEREWQQQLVLLAHDDMVNQKLGAAR